MVSAKVRTRTAAAAVAQRAAAQRAMAASRARSRSSSSPGARMPRVKASAPTTTESATWWRASAAGSPQRTSAPGSPRMRGAEFPETTRARRRARAVTAAPATVQRTGTAAGGRRESGVVMASSLLCGGGVRYRRSTPCSESGLPVDGMPRNAGATTGRRRMACWGRMEAGPTAARRCRPELEGKEAHMAVVIVGCGDVGTEAGLRFAAAGHRVEGWRRSPQVLPAAIRPVVADLAGELPRFPADTEVVVHAPAAGGRSVQAYRSVYLDGLAGVLRALERDRVVPRRIVLVSSTAVYADTEGTWIDETTPADPPTDTSVVLREAEELLAARAPQGVVLRLAGIYGPGRTRLVDKARTGAAEPGGDRFTNRIHRDDAAAAIVHLATGVADPAPVYNGVDREPAVLGE